MNTLNRIFNPDNRLFRQLARLTDVVGLSLLWTFLCLPLATAGMATSALYDATVRGVRLQNLSSVYLRFWQIMKSSWAVVTAATLFWLGLGWILFTCNQILVYMGNQGNRTAGLLYFAFRILLLAVLGSCLWFFLLLSRYRHGFVSGHVLALQLTFRHPLTTFMMAALVFEVAEFTWLHWWPVLFTPALTALLLSLFVERIWQKYDPGNSPFQSLAVGETGEVAE